MSYAEGSSCLFLSLIPITHDEAQVTDPYTTIRRAVLRRIARLKIRARTRELSKRLTH